MYRRFHRKRKNYRRYWNKEEWKKKQLLKQGYRYYIPSLNKAFKNYDEMIEFFKKVGWKNPKLLTDEEIVDFRRMGLVKRYYMVDVLDEGKIRWIADL